ncbi:signal peptidase [Enterococcus sp. PF1-24]|uniref:signal peptidase I n=1 Tax=unclassified Enterococcus TaxID=2608891 RepID=UPI002474B647|nr:MULTISPECIES: signal peptidase I [unclassified Enterococcus]MDH6363750.1 signal peptidase [Enterococcus sp. PFB1-1]MDH6400706.1 signal peptidase [Enterococcus sp. PF1-24]
MKKIKSFINVIILSLLVAIIGTNLYLIIQRKVFDVQVPTVFGYTSAVVISGSMAPEISVNDLVIVKTDEDYAAQDVIMFTDGNYHTTHRILEITPEGYITKGDANNTDDGLILKENVVGKVIFVVPLIGAIQEFLMTTQGLLFMFVLGGLFVWLFLKD